MHLSLLLPVIGLIFTVVSKLLLLYSTIDKTSQGFNLLPVASKAVPSVIASSVCWSLQCLVSALTQRGRWRTLCFFFFFRLTCSVALWGGREGCCKQITLACARSASATLGLPPLTARVTSLPTLLGL